MVTSEKTLYMTPSRCGDWPHATVERVIETTDDSGGVPGDGDQREHTWRKTARRFLNRKYPAFSSSQVLLVSCCGPVRCCTVPQRKAISNDLREAIVDNEEINMISAVFVDQLLKQWTSFSEPFWERISLILQCYEGGTNPDDKMGWHFLKSTILQLFKLSDFMQKNAFWDDKLQDS